MEGGTYEQFGGSQDLLESIARAGATEVENIFATLLALYFLSEAYDAQESEWTLIARKAREWLKTVGIIQASSLTKLIRVRLN